MEDANTAAITSNGVNTDYQVVKKYRLLKNVLVTNQKYNGESQLYIKLFLPRVQPNSKVHEWIA